ncbi:MAG: tripartite tricarboxylate transporter substrate binding protein [Trueperaceae bacterium]|nr:tripartite tricarboxylate transporter substrate binding protein [Trueperaceae bacterium]
MQILRAILTKALPILAALALTVSASAQDFPERPIQFIVPWPAGGTTDVIGRLLATSMSEELGTPVSVANRVGGGGALGSQAVLDAPKDGYTVLVTTSGNHILTPLSGDVGYTYDDFVPIGQVALRTLGLAVPADAPWESLDDLAEAAREDPGGLTFAAVPDVLPYLTMRGWLSEAGVEIRHIPTEGGAPAVTGVLGGHFDMVPAGLASVESQLSAGSLRLLAVFDQERNEAYPDVPTAIEQGYDVTGNPWTGLAVAQGVPDDVVQILRDSLATVMQDEEFLQRAADAGAATAYLDGPAFGERWQTRWERYEPILRGED